MDENKPSFIIHSFIHSVFHSFVCSLCVSFIHSFIFHSFTFTFDANWQTIQWESLSCWLMNLTPGGSIVWWPYLRDASFFFKKYYFIQSISFCCTYSYVKSFIFFLFEQVGGRSSLIPDPPLVVIIIYSILKHLERGFQIQKSKTNKQKY